MMGGLAMFVGGFIPTGTDLHSLAIQARADELVRRQCQFSMGLCEECFGVWTYSDGIVLALSANYRIWQGNCYYGLGTISCFSVRDGIATRLGSAVLSRGTISWDRTPVTVVGGANGNGLVVVCPTAGDHPVMLVLRVGDRGRRVTEVAAEKATLDKVMMRGNTVIIWVTGYRWNNRPHPPSENWISEPMVKRFRIGGK